MTNDVDRQTTVEQVDINEIIKQNTPRLPISKVKRIARMDPEYLMTANSAITATAFATELFIQALTEDAIMMNHFSSNGKNKQPRLSYNDLVSSATKKETFQFLEDVIPKIKKVSTTTNKKPVNQNTTNSDSRKLNKNQPTLPFMNNPNRATEEGKDEDVDMNSEQNESLEQEEQGNDGDENDDEYDDDEEGEELNLEVQEQLQEIERMNRVEDLNDDAQVPDNRSSLKLHRNMEENGDNLPSGDSDDFSE
ncbi:hypothetical protein KAFR_0A03690 [Kazachstania africana CBS 2517]|uniref:Transcription factor CBF/NF-Y/archaeal histone domain-containing protein n=1 Tax=Kazachstania africana (strain ATCC 22294 / BCRC 22015 / CBS 2517 / CECT 1963 / NBRC 1671 / NRRL Y-8276) TaxID=1071382 RepID=H2AN54_KAZAF|nr:hypothetical protein KAFR_0A03690 [Kazachstania africana CBS 2517]CCF55804.1 hypothetical protein KAFR_0A03690 [Kazachstania africana CBS 2517]